MRRKKEFGVKKRRASEISQAQIEDGGWETRFSDGCFFFLVERNLSRKKKSKKTPSCEMRDSKLCVLRDGKELLLAVHLLFLVSEEEQQRLAVVWGSAANVEGSLTILPFLGFDCHNEKCVGYFVYTHNILKFLEQISHTRKSRSATNENKENQKKV